MLLKLRKRPERRLQAVPLDCRAGSCVGNGACKRERERHGLQARREHDACATEGACPSLQRGAPLSRPPRLPAEWLLRHGACLNGERELSGRRSRQTRRRRG